MHKKIINFFEESINRYSTTSPHTGKKRFVGFVICNDDKIKKVKYTIVNTDNDFFKFSISKNTFVHEIITKNFKKGKRQFYGLIKIIYNNNERKIKQCQQ